ncbi:MAG: deoxyhypusine synthase family protein [Deltaproteobacteria bacterium]|nr:deoxyhypusine synthase family protein [Deltaproteobacteria bacterium]
MGQMKIRDFVNIHYRHFNAAVVRDAAKAYVEHLDSGGKMFLAMAGAMSTGELGVSLAEAIRRGKISAISCTGANLEEDIYNLIGHDGYESQANYKELTPEAEAQLRDQRRRRVTDITIPGETMSEVALAVQPLWKAADKKGESYFPYEYFYQLIDSGVLRKQYKIDPKDSWVVAACEKKIPIFTPGWEDCTLGNYLVADVLKGNISSTSVVKSGLDQMSHLVKWYKENSCDTSIGFFQIGGGIAGDFAICVVPLIIEDLAEDARYWGYFCQISDSTTSYGSYSGASPNEKITWLKLDVETPKFTIESDATIVVPLILGYVLDW